MSTREVQQFAEHMSSEADEKPQATGGMALPRKTELTQAEYDEMVLSMKANAEMYGRRRN